MDEAHTYFVGDGQWLVHNCPPTGDGGGDDRPDLSSVEDELRQVFNNPKFHPTNKQCHLCANDAGKILQDAGFDVDIVKIQNMYGKGGWLQINNPSGGDWTIADAGWHEVIRINHNGNEFFLDAGSYLTDGRINPRTRLEYAQLFGPNGIDAQFLVYFHSRPVGSTSTGLQRPLPNDAKNLLTGR